MKQVLDIPRTAMEVYNMLPEGTRCEVIDNTLFMSPAPTIAHQKVFGILFNRIFNRIEPEGLGEVYGAPCDVYLDGGLSVVQPDILFVKTDRVSIIEKRGVYGSPDLIIEILSSNKSHDTERKLGVYQRNQVQEYIIVDPETKETWHYLLTNGLYQQKPTTKGELFIEVLQLKIDF